MQAAMMYATVTKVITPIDTLLKWDEEDSAET